MIKLCVAAVINKLSGMGVFSVYWYAIGMNLQIQEMGHTILKFIDCELLITVKAVEALQNFVNIIGFDKEESVVDISSVEFNQATVDHLIHHHLF